MRVAAGRETPVVRELADRREHDDRGCVGCRVPTGHSKKRLAPRNSLARWLTGMIRTSLSEFGASIIIPLPMYIVTWPTTGRS